MSKNRVSIMPPGKVLVDFVSNPRSAAFKEVCAICTDKNGLQSDRAAARLRAEITAVLRNLLKGRNLDAASQRINRNTRKPSQIRIHHIGEKDDKPLAPTNFYSIPKNIRLGDRTVCLDTTYSIDATPRQIIHGVLRRSLQTDIERLALCQECEKLFYRKSLKGKFCSNKCRWKHHNHSEERKKRYLKGQWYPRKEAN